MKVCILENDHLNADVAERYGGYGAMFERLLREAGATGQFEVFNTVDGQYPASWDGYDAVLLTGGRADAFSDEPWVVTLRETVHELLARGAPPKLMGVCLGHQIIALCMGAKVDRWPQGWGAGRMRYQWVGPHFAGEESRQEIALLASHRDQVFELPKGATLLASSAFCPVAAFAVDERILCVQPHPEFVEDYSAYLLDFRRRALGEALYAQAQQELTKGHEGAAFARMMVAFINGQGPLAPKVASPAAS
jgi:GMP synthase-like glutamine amidotransferase